MRKRNSLISRISVICVLMTTVACADYDATEAVTSGGDPLDVRAEINQQYTTRASDGGFATGDEIGVFIVNYPVSSADGDWQPPTLQPTGNHADNVRFTYDEATGKWTGSYQLYWKDKKTPIDAYGYYPFDAALANTTAYPFSIQTNQRDHMSTGRKLTGYEQSDFLWAKNEGVIPTAGAITLRHHHLMAGIKVTLHEGVGFDEGEWDDIQKIVLIESTVTESTINLQTGSVSVSGGSPVGTITPLPIAGGNEGGASFRAVVIPQTIAAGKLLFSLTIDNKSYKFSCQEQMVYYPGKLHQ